MGRVTRRIGETRMSCLIDVIYMRNDLPNRNVRDMVRHGTARHGGTRVCSATINGKPVRLEPLLAISWACDTTPAYFAA